MLIIYEVGVETLTGGHSEACRNGADTWLRWLLAQIGLTESFYPGIFIGIGLVAWAWCATEDTPGEIVNVWMGMVVESAVFAVGLWGASFLILPMLENLPMAVATHTDDPSIRHAVCFPRSRNLRRSSLPAHPSVPVVLSISTRRPARIRFRSPGGCHLIANFCRSAPCRTCRRKLQRFGVLIPHLGPEYILPSCFGGEDLESRSARMPATTSWSVWYCRRFRFDQASLD